MPISTMAARRSVEFDEDLQIRAYSASAISSTTSETGIALRADHYTDFVVVLDVAAYTGTFAAGSLQWAIAVEISDTLGSGYTVVQTVVPAGTATRYELSISGTEAAKLEPGPKFIRTTATKTGAPGNLTYGAYVSTYRA